MRTISRYAAATLLVWLAACTHREATLYGQYVAYDPGLDVVKPPVTLEIARQHRYTFCQAARCVQGSWSLRGRRIILTGRELEDWTRRLADATFDPDPADAHRGSLGFIELDYDTALIGTRISLGAGDAAFIKRSR